MDLYILGIGGTFMGHLALLAKQLGLRVSGCDTNIYSPMKEMLRENEITYDEGYDADHLNDQQALYVVGNAIGRGNQIIEVLLNEQRPMVSGPDWLYQNILRHRWVIAIAGTHGKTTTTSMVTWILKTLGYKPGYLIGGAAKGFKQAASLGSSDIFVIEADEYDTAFFDKRSKFIHYRPKTLVLNNLEFDHADIFDSLKDIQKTMHHLVRIVPACGRVIYPQKDTALQQVLAMGCWSEKYPLWSGASEVQPDEGVLTARALNSDMSSIEISVGKDHENFAKVPEGDPCILEWDVIGSHNMQNGLAALAAVEHLGVARSEAVQALQSFPGVARRMDLRFQASGINVYDDFAHHPTAIAASLAALRAKVGQAPLIAFIEPRSNTMCMGVHADQLLNAVSKADFVYWLQSPKLSFDLEALCKTTKNHRVFDDAQTMLQAALDQKAESTSEKQHWLCMSNGNFGGLFELMQAQLSFQR